MTEFSFWGIRSTNLFTYQLSNSTFLPCPQWSAETSVPSRQTRTCGRRWSKSAPPESTGRSLPCFPNRVAWRGPVRSGRRFSAAFVRAPGAFCSPAACTSEKRGSGAPRGIKTSWRRTRRPNNPSPFPAPWSTTERGHSSFRRGTATKRSSPKVGWKRERWERWTFGGSWLISGFGHLLLTQEVFSLDTLWYRKYQSSYISWTQCM